MPTQIDFDIAEAELNAAEKVYRQKLAGIVALARDTLAATVGDAILTSSAPNEGPPATDRNKVPGQM
jgi:hypothetical protein